MVYLCIGLVQYAGNTNVSDLQITSQCLQCWACMLPTYAVATRFAGQDRSTLSWLVTGFCGSFRIQLTGQYGARVAYMCRSEKLGKAQSH